MGIKLKDILNKKINKRNNQISFDLKKKKIKLLDISIDDILETELNKEKESFKHGFY